VGATVVVGTLKLGSAVLGGVAHLVQELAGVGSPAPLTSDRLDDAIPTPAGVVRARARVPVAPEGFVTSAGRKRAGRGVDRARSDVERGGAGVEDVLDAEARTGARLHAVRRETAAMPGEEFDEPDELDELDVDELDELEELDQLDEPEDAARAQIGAPHVDEEAVLVAEFADAGAENGAGAQVHVEEPWHEYRVMKALEIIDRVVAEREDVLTLVLLYERAHRNRRTVLAAAERELERRMARAS
jgi:hypothetical protein